MFQSTLPAWGATGSVQEFRRHTAVPIHAPAWGATASRSPRRAIRGFQSTLPRGERQLRAALAVPSGGFLAPRVGSEAIPAKHTDDRQAFQSTLRVWGATRSRLVLFGAHISIHAPRVGSDAGVSVLGATFQSTLPAWGATSSVCVSRGATAVSIHAPRVGSDPTSPPQGGDGFNPRSPCGERRASRAIP
jgi:hypothetical protein